MRRFKNIMFVADVGNNQKYALTRAMDLAKSNQAKLTVIDVIKEISFDSTDSESINKADYFQDILIEDRRKELEQLVKSVAIKHQYAPASIEIRTGKEFIEIIRTVIHNKHDLLIKLGKGSFGFVQRMFGSTDLKLIRKCPCPVWIIKKTKRKRFSRILAAVDPDPTRSESLNRLILDLATSLAKKEKSELHVVHAWQFENETVLKSGQIPKKELYELIDGMQNAHQHQFDLLLSHYRSHKKTIHIIKGDPGEVIPNLASQQDVDLIVMGTVGRTGITGLIMGNTAEEILNAVDCSVLTVKPEGFKFAV